MDYRTGTPERVLLEPVRWLIARSLGDDFGFKLSLDRKLGEFAVRCEAVFMARELRDQKTTESRTETIDVPDGPWNQVKDAVNQWLDRINKTFRSMSIIPFEPRFRVQTRRLELTQQTIVKRVYHMCPHISKDFKEKDRTHYAWVLGGPADERLNFRYLHLIRPHVQEGLKNPLLATEALARIDEIIRSTGAFPY